MVKKEFLNVSCNSFYLWSFMHPKVGKCLKTWKCIENNDNDLYILFKERYTKN